MPLTTLTDEEALIAGVDVFAKSRDLKEFPPKDPESMTEIGLSKTMLDAPVRAWVNARFRKPNGWDLLKSGDLKPAMKWKAFKAKCLTKDGD